MCYYIRLIPLCRHPPPTLLAAPSFCTELRRQLMRIYDPVEWERMRAADSRWASSAQFSSPWHDQGQDNDLGDGQGHSQDLGVNHPGDGDGGGGGTTAGEFDSHLSPPRTEPLTPPPAFIVTPFDLPPQCAPHAYNVLDLPVDDYCGWECRNNHYHASAVAGAVWDDGVDAVTGAFRVGRPPGWGRMGMLSAQYGPGSEREGVGWRTG